MRIKRSSTRLRETQRLHQNINNAFVFRAYVLFKLFFFPNTMAYRFEVQFNCFTVFVRISLSRKII